MMETGTISARSIAWVSKRSAQRLPREELAAHVSISQGWDARFSLSGRGARGGASMSAPSILVIEDEPAIQELVAYTCSTQGYTVRRADSVGAGRDAIDRELPDMVLLDWMLPDKSGIELLKDLRAHERTKVMPVIMLTAKGNEADKVGGSTPCRD